MSGKIADLPQGPGWGTASRVAPSGWNQAALSVATSGWNQAEKRALALERSYQALNIHSHGAVG